MHANTRALVRAFLAIVAVAGLSCGERPSGERPPSKSAAAPAQQEEARASTSPRVAARRSTAEANTADTVAKTVTVYYFHTTFRCRTCNLMEALTKEAVEEGFSEEQGSGRVVFKAVNVEEKQNRHFVERYKLHTKSVVVSISSGEEEKGWKNLDQIWTKVRGTPEEFKRYITNGVREALG